MSDVYPYNCQSYNNVRSPTTPYHGYSCRKNNTPFRAHFNEACHVSGIIVEGLIFTFSFDFVARHPSIVGVTGHGLVQARFVYVINRSLFI